MEKVVNVYSTRLFPLQSLEPTATGIAIVFPGRRNHREQGPECGKNMSRQWNRRDVLKGLVAASTAVTSSLRKGLAEENPPATAQPLEIQITPISPHTF